MANFGPGTSRRTAVPDVPPRLTPTLLTIGWPARSSRRHESACHTNGAWHIAPTVWATPRIAALPEGAASARGSARGGGPGVGPLRRVRRTEPGIRCVAHLRL